MNDIQTPSSVNALVEKEAGIPIGGFLWFCILGLIISPFRVLYSLYTDYLPIFTNGVWDIILAEGDAFRHYFLAVLIVGEVTVNFFMVVFPVIILWFFYKRSKKSRVLVICWLCLTMVFVVGDYFLAGFLLPEAKEDPENTKILSQTIVSTAIWLPYFIFSKRVKATFVN